MVKAWEWGDEGDEGDEGGGLSPPAPTSTAEKMDRDIESH